MKNVNPHQMGISKFLTRAGGGGGACAPPDVRLTSNQALFSSLFVVLRSIKKIDQFGPWRDPGGPLIDQGPPIPASHLGSTLGSMKAHEGSLDLGEVH